MKSVAVKFNEAGDIIAFATPGPGKDEVDVGDDTELVLGKWVSKQEYEALLDAAWKYKELCK